MKADIEGLEFRSDGQTSDVTASSKEYMIFDLKYSLNENHDGFYANSYKIIGYKINGGIDTIFEYEAGNRIFLLVDGEKIAYRKEWQNCIEIRKISKEDINIIDKIIKVYRLENRHDISCQQEIKTFRFILDLYLQQVKLYYQKKGKRKNLSLQGNILN